MSSSFSRDVLWTLFTRLLAGGSLAAAEVFVSSLLKAEGRGSFALFLTSQALIDALVSMGFPAAIIRSVSQGQYSAPQMATWSVVWGTVQGLAGAFLFHFVVVWIRPGFLADFRLDLLSWMYLCLPSFLVSHYLGCIFLAQQKSSAFNLIFLSQRLFFCLFAWYLFWRGGTLFALTGLYSVSAFLSVLVAVLYAGIQFRFSARIRGVLRSYLDLYRFGSGVQVGNIFEKFALRSDIYLVNNFVGLDQLGYYAVARAASDILAYFPVSISLMLFPRVSQDPSARPPASTARICRLFLFLQFVSFLVLSYPTWIVIRWLLPEFQPSIPLFFLLIPGCIGYGLYQILSLDSMGRNQNRLYVGFSAAYFVLVVVCNLLFLPGLHVYGGAVGTSLAGILIGLAFVLLYSLLHRIPFYSLLVPLRRDFHNLRGRIDRLRESRPVTVYPNEM